MMFQILLLAIVISCYEISCDSLHHELKNVSFSPSSKSAISESSIISATFDYESDYNNDENIYATIYAHDKNGKMLYLASKRLVSSIGREKLEFLVSDDFIDDPIYKYPFKLILVLERINPLMEVEVLEKSNVVIYK